MTTHKIIQITPYGYKNMNLYLKIERNGLEFQPGTCVAMFDRTYSVASGINEQNYLEFLIKLVPNGEASGHFSNLSPNDTIEITDTFSFFTPGKDQTTGNYTYFATGTGIAPFRSALLSYDHVPDRVYWGGKDFDDSWDLLKFAERVNIRPASSGNQFNLIPVHITEYKDEYKISRDHMYYLCGLDAMIDQVSNILMEQGITYEQIQTEQFFQSLF